MFICAAAAAAAAVTAASPAAAATFVSGTAVAERLKVAAILRVTAKLTRYDSKSVSQPNSFTLVSCVSAEDTFNLKYCYRTSVL